MPRLLRSARSGESNFIYVKWATALIMPAQVVFLRVLFGFLPLAFMAWRAKVITHEHLRYRGLAAEVDCGRGPNELPCSTRDNNVRDA